MKLKTLCLALISISLLVMVAGCIPKPPTQPTTLHQISASLDNGIAGNKNLAKRRRIPPSVSAALVPGISINLPGAKKSFGRRFNISVHSVPAKTFFMSLVQGTNYNMVVSPEVKGTISLNLKHVTIDEALTIVRDVYGYDYQKTGFGYEVFPNKLQTRMFTVNYLDAERNGTSVTTVSTGQISQKIQGSTGSSFGASRVSRTTTQQQKRSGGEVETKTKVNFWAELSRTLTAMIGNKAGQTVVINPQGGLVVVKAYPKQLRQVSQYLDALQHNMDRQVILEAKILEVTLNDQYQAGIDWKIFGATLNALKPKETFPGTDIDNAKFSDAFKIKVSSGNNFSMTIQALGTQGNVQVLSNPRISTLNNQKAIIKVGSDEFFVTGISTSTTENAGGSTTPTQDVQLTPFFSGITLDVTPQIDSNGWITLHIHPSVSKVVDQQKQLIIANQESKLPLALSTIRETDTVVRARDHQVVVLGGLMEHQTREDVAQVPFFGNIPFLGALFRNTKQTSLKSELVILIRPIVVGKGTWNRDLKQARHVYHGMNRGFHFGDRPDLYGTEAERHIYSNYHHTAYNSK